MEPKKGDRFTDGTEILEIKDANEMVVVYRYDSQQTWEPNIKRHLDSFGRMLRDLKFKQINQERK